MCLLLKIGLCLLQEGKPLSVSTCHFTESRCSKGLSVKHLLYMHVQAVYVQALLLHVHIHRHTVTCILYHLHAQAGIT